MSSPSNLESANLAGETTPEQVEAYLQDNPDFFVDHAALLAELNIPHDSGSAISLVEKQLQVLREQNQQYKRKLMELVDIGRENDALHASIHRLTVALMRAGSLEAMIDALCAMLLGEFQADALGLRLANLPAGFQDNRVQPFDRNDPALEVFDKYFEAPRPLCGYLKPDQLDYLFADRVSQVQSTALIPLGENAEYGLLAVGSEDPNTYHPGKDTQFLRNISDLIGCALAHPCPPQETTGD